ncbi:catechol O-methyltransferase-like [Acanthaster planci]|uniref:catechol O-methyltransferase n=1 Tax=Acanthaster planci TaxID=133434 RepID=A0A8B7XPF0_ACAPL|nr:catechol O-methyltransferase-like [Acanthaster planci]
MCCEDLNAERSQRNTVLNMGFLADVKGFLELIYEIGSPKFFWITFTRIIFPYFWRTLWHGKSIEYRALDFVKKTAKEGNPGSVLDALEEYHLNYEVMMAVMPEKRRKIEEVARKAAPKVCLEMGCFVGVSAMAVARHIPPGGRLITTEIDTLTAKAARELFSFAGLDQVITVVNERAEDVIKVLRSEYSVDKLDLVVLDHRKWSYLPDLKALEKGGFLHKGTVIIADDCFWPCVPGYLEYVENDPRYQTERFYSVSFPGVFDIPDAIAISTYKGGDNN